MCRIVEEMIGIVDNVIGRYELILCDHCKDSQHQDCTGKKSKLHIAGYEVLGPCQCEDSAHNSLRKGKSDGSTDAE